NLSDFLDRALLLGPLRHSTAESSGDALDPDASQTHSRFFQMLFILGDQDDFFVEPQNRRRPGSVLAAERDVDRPGNVTGPELLRRTRVEHDRSGFLPCEDLV